MANRQSLITKVATRLAKSTDYHTKPSQSKLGISIVEITTDENEEYVTTATDTQWERYETAVMKLAETLHWNKYHRLFD